MCERMLPPSCCVMSNSVNSVKFGGQPLASSTNNLNAASRVSLDLHFGGASGPCLSIVGMSNRQPSKISLIKPPLKIEGELCVKFLI